MKLKTVPKGGYPPAVCAASRCTQTAARIVPRGTAFPGSRGHVPLCKSHIDKATQEKGELGTALSAVAEGGEAPPPGATPAMLSVVPSEKPEALAREAKDAEAALDLIKEFELDTQADYDFADELLGDAKRQWRELEARKKKATAPLQESLKEIRSWFKPPQDFYAEAERLLKFKIAEAHKAARETQDAALAVAQEAFEAGDTAELDQAVVAAAQAEVVQSKQITMQRIWQWEITDANALPREYLTPDRTAIGAAVRQLKGATEIPGVRVWQDERVIRRGA